MKSSELSFFSLALLIIALRKSSTVLSFSTLTENEFLECKRIEQKILILLSEAEGKNPPVSDDALVLELDAEGGMCRAICGVNKKDATGT